MTRRPLEHLLGSGARDPGCDAAFEVLDQYVEALRRGDNVDERFAGFVAHIRNCAACREDADALRAALDSLDPPPPPRRPARPPKPGR